MDSDLIEFSEELKIAKELLKEWEICNRGGMEYGRFSAESKMPKVLGNLVEKLSELETKTITQRLLENKKNIAEIRENCKKVREQIIKNNKKIDCWMRGCSHSYEITFTGFKTMFRHKLNCPNADYEM